MKKFAKKYSWLFTAKIKNWFGEIIFPEIFWALFFKLPDVKRPNTIVNKKRSQVLKT